MHILKSSSSSRSRTRPRFIPWGFFGIEGSRLESRALTTGAFWRYPAGTGPGPDLATAFMGVGFGGSGISSSVGSNSQDPTYAHVSGSSVVDGLDINGNPDGNVSTVIGQTSTTIIDNAQAPYGAPIGTYVVQFDTASQLLMGTTGDPTGQDGIVNNVGTGSTVARAYVIADDGSGGGTTLVEHYTIHYDGPTNPGVGNNPGATGSGIVTGSGFTVAWAPAAGLTLGSNGTWFGGGSLTFTDPATGGVYNVTGVETGTTSDFDVTYTINLGTLPTQVSNLSTPLVGYQYPVAAWAAMNYNIAMPANSNEIDDLTTHFDARIV